MNDSLNQTTNSAISFASKVSPTVIEKSQRREGNEIENQPKLNLDELARSNHLQTKEELSSWKQELCILIHKCKYEEAFLTALEQRDVSIVSWLCSQVDLPEILPDLTKPMNPAVLLSHLQQQTSDLSPDKHIKLSWLVTLTRVINPTDTSITKHIRPILTQVNETLEHRHRLIRNRDLDFASGINTIMLLIKMVSRRCK